MRMLFRGIAAVLLGLLVALLINVSVGMLGNHLYPLPAGIDPSDTDALRTIAAGRPVGWFLLWLLGAVAGAFEGSWLAGRIAGRARMVCAMLVAAILVASGVTAIVRGTQLDRFSLAGLLLIPLAGYAGGTLATPALIAPVTWAAVTSLGIVLVISSVAVVSGISEVLLWRRLAQGQDIPAADISQILARQSLISWLQFLMIVVTASIFLVWFHRCYARARELSPTNLKDTARRAVGYWFIPFVNLVRPFSITKEMWTSLTRRTSVEPASGTLINFWWGTWLLSLFLDRTALILAGSAKHVADYTLVFAAATSVLAKVTAIAAAVLAIGVVRRIGRHAAGA